MKHRRFFLLTGVSILLAVFLIPSIEELAWAEVGIKLLVVVAAVAISVVLEWVSDRREAKHAEKPPEQVDPSEPDPGSSNDPARKGAVSQ